jgi:hypothetical protein
LLPSWPTSDKRSLFVGCGWRFFDGNWLRLRRRCIRNLVAFGLLVTFVIDSLASSTRHVPVMIMWSVWTGFCSHEIHPPGARVHLLQVWLSLDLSCVRAVDVTACSPLPSV